ncbi:MAG: hypothetical protein ACPGSB_02010 [Opitutales bacterium]
MITAIKEGDHLKIISSTEEIPENVTLHLALTEEDSWGRAQIETEFRSEEDWGDSLNSLVQK